jgi:hypothetical protein
MACAYFPTICGRDRHTGHGAISRGDDASIAISFDGFDVPNRPVRRRCWRRRSASRVQR